MNFLSLLTIAGIMCCWTVYAPIVIISSALAGEVKSTCGQAVSTHRSKKCGGCMTPSRKNRNG